jgi:uncharacterized protein YcfJ
VGSIVGSIGESIVGSIGESIVGSIGESIGGSIGGSIEESIRKKSLKLITNTRVKSASWPLNRLFRREKDKWKV